MRVYPFIGMLLLFWQLMAAPVLGAEPPKKAKAPDLEPKAGEVLKQMCDYLKNLQQFSVQAEITEDVLLTSGQRIQFARSVEASVRRPDRLWAESAGDTDKRQFFYDGKTFTIYGNTNKFYASVPAPATIHELLDVAQERYAIDLPFRDLFAWGTDRADVAAIQSAIFIGPTKIDNVPCDHYAFRNVDVDWQIWIQQGEKPLPRKLVITTMDEEQHPQYVSMMNWNLSPKINNKLFTFVPPKDAHKIELAVVEVATENSK